MIEDFVKILGAVPGPTSIIIGGVHGDETCGVKTLDKLIAELRIEKGTVYLGYGNPTAIEKGIRQTAANLNRMFYDEGLSPADRQSYEYGRAQLLKQYLNQASALLDIHASFTPQSRPFAICESNAAGIIEHLPVDLVVSGFDAVEPGGTDYYMNKIGQIGICVECGYHRDPSSDERALQAAYSFLRSRGHLSGENATHHQEHILMRSLYKNRASHFTLSRPFADFEELAEGELIGRDGEDDVRAKAGDIILFAQDTASPGQECFLSGNKNARH